MGWGIELSSEGNISPRTYTNARERNATATWGYSFMCISAAGTSIVAQFRFRDCFSMKLAHLKESLR
jgi:hypothetical protein